MHAAGLVDLFVTSVATFPGNSWDRLSRTSFGAEFARREFDKSLQSVTRQHPWRELARLACGKLGLDRLTRHEHGVFSIDAVYQSHDRFVAKHLRSSQSLPDRRAAVYCYEDGARLTFAQAKKQGVRCLYDLPIGYWRSAQTLLQSESHRWPQWASTMPGFRDSPQKLERKDEELRLADAIFVASSFTAKTLDDFPDKSLADVNVIPYGFPPVFTSRQYAPLRGRKLRLLFVGGLSQRKGIADVFAVADALKNHAELTVIGRGDVSNCPALASALSRHRWIETLPHQRVLEEMRTADVLLFPSLFEGFGLVITEAMSQGTPVITTDRTAGPDVIEHGKSGWLVPAGDTPALLQQVEALLNHPDQIADAGRRAMQSAAKRPWSRYGDDLAGKVAEILGIDHHSDFAAVVGE